MSKTLTSIIVIFISLILLITAALVLFRHHVVCQCKNVPEDCVSAQKCESLLVHGWTTLCLDYGQKVECAGLTLQLGRLVQLDALSYMMENTVYLGSIIATTYYIVRFFCSLSTANNSEPKRKRKLGKKYRSPSSSSPPSSQSPPRNHRRAADPTGASQRSRSKTILFKDEEGKGFEAEIDHDDLQQACEDRHLSSIVRAKNIKVYTVKRSAGSNNNSSKKK